MDAHRHNDDGVDRHADAADAGRQHVGHAVAAQGGHVASAQPGEARGVEPCRQAAGVPGAVLEAPLPAPGADQERVARLDLHARLRLGRQIPVGRRDEPDVDVLGPAADLLHRSRRGSRCRASLRGRCGTTRQCGWWRSRGARWRSSPPPSPRSPSPSCDGPPGLGCRPRAACRVGGRRTRSGPSAPLPRRPP